ncbi:MAG: DUF2334 domain-containing protein [Lachnospiraceae bacterium]|nr:DUF2334 domain-containing protein [Lachnospiraceae bacterium]
MQIAIRMDDITPDMDWERFHTFKKMLDKLGIKPLIGVVPDNRDDNLHRMETCDDFWKYIKELQDSGWCIALHGYQHVYTTSKGGLFPLNCFSEFAGIPLSHQRMMIQEGTEILRQHGISTDIFMAPAHSYDRNTLKALKEFGYNKITDGFGKRPYRWQGLTFYPISFMLSRSFKKKKGITTMVVHTNEIDDAGMKRLEELLQSHRDSLISYENFGMAESVDRGFLGHLAEYLLAVMKRILVKLKSQIK